MLFLFGITNYFAFLAAGILLNLSPGADTVYVLSRSVSQGKKAGIASALGIGTGALLQTLFTAFGLSVLLKESVLIFGIIKVIGACYLIYLGIQQLLRSRTTLELDEPNHKTNVKLYLKAILTNVSNPEVTIFYLTFLPQFIQQGNPYGPLPFIILGLTLAATGTLYSVILALFAAKFTDTFRNGKMALVLNRAAGAVFIILGVIAFLV